ncbi:MAG: hypothetical protein ACXVH7_13330 [Thermoanaerobaculia bacterium]
MAYSVHFTVDLTPLPEKARDEIQRTLQQIAEGVANVPPASAFWASMDDSVLQIDVEGFRLTYRIDHRNQEIRVCSFRLA